MNWFKFAQILLAVGGQAINLFVKNPQSKKVADAVQNATRSWWLGNSEGVIKPVPEVAAGK